MITIRMVMMIIKTMIVMTMTKTKMMMIVMANDANIINDSECNNDVFS